MKADGLTPEVDRLGDGKFVIRGNQAPAQSTSGGTVTLKTKGERNARGVFSISPNDSRVVVSYSN